MVKYKIADWVTDHIDIHNEKNRLKIYANLSANPHDGAADMLDKNPELIDMYALCENRNPRYADLIINYAKGRKQPLEDLDSLLLNSNDKVVDFCLSELKKFTEDDYATIFIDLFCSNPNNKAVDFCLEHEDVFENPAPHFLLNPNQRIVDNILEETKNMSRDELLDFLYQEGIQANPNNRIVDLLLLPGVDPDYDYLPLNTNKRLLPKIKKVVSKNPLHAFHIFANPLIFEVDNNTSCVKYKPIKCINIDISYLSANPSDKALDILERNPDKIIWKKLSKNTNRRAVKLLIENKNNIDWQAFSSNPGKEAVELLLTKKARVDYKGLSSNTNSKVFPLLKENLWKVNWRVLSANPNDKAVDILLANKGNIDFEALSLNSNDRAVDYLLQDPGNISYSNLSTNPNDRVVDYLIRQPSLIDWNCFAANINNKAIDFLIKNIPKIDLTNKIFLQSIASNKNPKIFRFIECLGEYFDEDSLHILLENPNIFQLDYEEMRKCRNDMKRELVEKTMNPKELEKKIRKERWRIVRERDNKKTYDSKPVVTPENDPPWLEDVDVDLDRIL